MNKNKLMMGLIGSAMAASSVMPAAFAAQAADSPASQTTQVEYTVAETEWMWEVPATLTFTMDDVDTAGTVSIKPAVADTVIALAENTKLDITLNSKYGYKLKNDSALDKSVIDYQVKKNGEADALGQDANVLNFTAGTSSNLGVSQDLDFVTTVENLKKATVVGEHKDVITFTVAVTPGA